MRNGRQKGTWFLLYYNERSAGSDSQSTPDATNCFPVPAYPVVPGGDFRIKYEIRLAPDVQADFFCVSILTVF